METLDHDDFMQFPRNANFRAPRILGLGTGVCALLAACSGPPPPLMLSGETMGTTYTIKVLPLPGKEDGDALRAAIDALLEAINAEMSTYRPDSALSRINTDRSVAWQPISAELHEVLAAAQQVSRATGGAFDITVAPLVEVWGFGPESLPRRVPDDASVAAAGARVGYRYLELARDPPRLRKQQPELALDLGGIAPGYAVDRIAALLDGRGYHDYLVELGGEIKARGHNAAGQIWQVGIEAPLEDTREVERIVSLRDSGLTTSGDYRDYFEEGGVRYSHVIDPVARRPVRHSLAAVAVIHPSTMLADAYATGLFVLGPERGYALAEELGLAALFYIRGATGFATRASPAFAALADAPQGPP